MQVPNAEYHDNVVEPSERYRYANADNVFHASTVFPVCVNLRIQTVGKLCALNILISKKTLSRKLKWLMCISIAIITLENLLPLNEPLGKHAESWNACGTGSPLSLS